MAAVAAHFRLPYSTHPAVEEADLRVLMTERRDLMRGAEPPWTPMEVEPLHDCIKPRSPEAARLEYQWILRAALVGSGRIDIATELG